MLKDVYNGHSQMVPKLVFENAIFNITNWGAGKSTEVIPLEFDVMSNGKPEYTAGE